MGRINKAAKLETRVFVFNWFFFSGRSSRESRSAEGDHLGCILHLLYEHRYVSQTDGLHVYGTRLAERDRILLDVRSPYAENLEVFQANFHFCDFKSKSTPIRQTFYKNNWIVINIKCLFVLAIIDVI
jgi:hypothetical protein